MQEWIGKTVGKVRIEKAIAKGGMAEVYLGTHLTLDRPVAVKVMHHFVESDPDLQSRFEREAKVVAGLRHPSIVQIFDYDTADGHPYIVMEYLKGTSLANYLRDLHKRNARLQPAQIAKLLITIATALDYAHEKGVIHRDIKPGNIILHATIDEISMDQPITEQAEAVLTDFGLVRIAQSVTQTASGAVSGTPAYMSPEQAQGVRVDHRSDIYSLGVVLYEMVAGRIPFEGDTSWTVIFKHINETPPPIAGLQPAVQRVIERALAKNPEARYQTARALAADYMDAIGMFAEAGTLRMSLPASPLRRGDASQAHSSVRIPPTQNGPAPVSQSAETRSAPAWLRLAAIVGLAVLGLAVGSFLLARLNSPRQSTVLPTPALAATQGSTAIPGGQNPTADPIVVAPIESPEPVGLLRFQDGTAPVDAATLSTSSLPLPPEGNLYEVWLIQDDGEQRISLGVINFDPENRGSLRFVDREGRNLLGIYSALEITVEPNDANPNSSNNIAFSVRLPEAGLTHVRHLLYSFNATPNQVGFVGGLDANTKLLTDLSAQMLSAFEIGNEAELRSQAERMMNIIVGRKSTDYRDWDANGAIDDPGDGYGLLQNEDQLGYIQGTFAHADLALTSQDATENMLTHGEHVKVSADNVSNWTGLLRTQLLAILENPSSPDREAAIRQAVALANQIRNGVDINGNENIEPIKDEGGARTAYEHAYYMADMLILPAANQTPTP